MLSAAQEIDVQRTSGRRISAARCRAARVQAHLTQEDLAALLQVRAPTVSNRERGAVVPWEVWLALAQVLGLPTDWEPPKGDG